MSLAVSAKKPSILSSALSEMRGGSYDGYVQGLKILGAEFEKAFPEISRLPEQWLKLKGTERAELAVIQKKACHILSTLLEHPEIDVASDPALKNRLATIEFLTNLSLQYGQKLTKEVYLRIQTSIREKFDSGEETLSPEQQVVLVKRLSLAQSNLIQKSLTFELPSPPTIAPLPSADRRYSYWKSVSNITRSREGQIGVFYLHSRALERNLVVKAPLHPAQECFASRIFQKLGFLTPDAVIINRKSAEGQLIEKALEPSKDFELHRQDVSFTRFFVMSRIYGRSFEEIDEPYAAQAFTNDNISLKALLKQIGMVAAMDSLLHYQDRLSHIGYSNWGNLMCVERQGRLSFAVAIDQSVDLSKSSVYLSSKAKSKRAVAIADDVLKTPKSVSQAARDIWEDFPAHIKQYIKPSEALAALQEGLVAGFTAIAKQLTPKLLLEIDRELSGFYTKRDFVTVEDLITLQQTIAAKI